MSDLSSLNIDDILANFELFEDWEDKYVYLMELGKKLPELDIQDKNETNKIHGCQAEVWVKPRIDRSTSPGRLYLEGDSNSAIVKGLVAIVILLFSGQPIQSIPGINEKQVFANLGLDQYLSPTRKVGLASMVEKIKNLSQSPEEIT
ncbi:MAG: SufE family protein [Verrucomicrobia bacterium]|nr:SufE family protein [Verrucomicrobiota bacterium]